MVLHCEGCCWCALRSCAVLNLLCRAVLCYVLFPLQLIMMEHQAEKHALEAHHREEEERRRAAVHAMQPGCPWHGVPPALQFDTEWQVGVPKLCLQCAASIQLGWAIAQLLAQIACLERGLLQQQRCLRPPPAAALLL